MIDAYLSPKHAAHTDRGCPVAALGPELARSGGKTHRDLARGVKRRLEWMRGLFPGRRRGRAADTKAAGTLACMVGGVILARSVGGEDGASILEACRRFLHDALED